MTAASILGHPAAARAELAVNGPDGLAVVTAEGQFVQLNEAAVDVANERHQQRRVAAIARTAAKLASQGSVTP